MDWCCHSAKDRFKSRTTCGEFLVAGLHSDLNDVWFFTGFNMAHRGDYSDVIGAIKEADAAMAGIGISNFKLAEHRCAHFCSHCGAKLSKFYGPEGGCLRDDAYVKEMRGST